MPKRVLGNDPFLRGAAERAPAPPPPPKGGARPARPRATAAPPPPATQAAKGTPGTVAPAAAPLDLAAAWGALRAAVEAIRAGVGSAADVELDVYGGDAHLQAAVAPLAEFLYTHWFRVTVEGAEHVPRGGALLVANHAGALPIDGPILHQALKRSRPDLPDSRWLVEDQVFYAPVLGTLLNRLGGVRASPDNATRLLGEGRPVLVFPEGIQGIGKPFRERYRLKRFGRGGFVKLALRTGVSILPVAVVGGEESLPLLAKLPAGFLGMPYLPVTPLGPVPLPARWFVRIGAPISLPDRGAAKGEVATLAVLEAIVERTRRSIEEMLQKLLRARAGVFSG
ncbi:MAG TPA: lysophospholipid acyltransferase family protein [Myxococcaceae bacterium]|nr:lysophospholipid acyltransferase family protein [Myxococcaceae bacterium]